MEITQRNDLHCPWCNSVTECFVVDYGRKRMYICRICKKEPTGEDQSGHECFSDDLSPLTQESDDFLPLTQEEKEKLFLTTKTLFQNTRAE